MKEKGLSTRKICRNRSMRWYDNLLLTISPYDHLIGLSQSRQPPAVAQALNGLSYTDGTLWTSPYKPA